MLTIYLIVGILAGMMSGLFGIGGGVVVIPALSMIFSHSKIIPVSSSMQMAVGTSLAIMIFTGASALYVHYKHKTVRWDMFGNMLPGLMLGSIGGAIIAHFLPSSFLRILFAVFLLLVSIRMIMGKPISHTARGPSIIFIRIASLGIGLLSSLLGVGGGTLLVPFLLRCQLDMREAAGTSIACGLSIGIVATISFMIAGLSSFQQTPLSTGYIYWPAFAGVAIASILLAPIGAILGQKLPKEILKRSFGWFLLIMACDMLFFK